MVAGGYLSNSWRRHVEIYTIGNDTWTYGKSLPTMFQSRKFFLAYLTMSMEDKEEEGLVVLRQKGSTYVLFKYQSQDDYWEEVRSEDNNGYKGNQISVKIVGKQLCSRD